MSSGRLSICRETSLEALWQQECLHPTVVELHMHARIGPWPKQMCAGEQALEWSDACHFWRPRPCDQCPPRPAPQGTSEAVAEPALGALCCTVVDCSVLCCVVLCCKCRLNSDVYLNDDSFGMQQRGCIVLEAGQSVRSSVAADR